MKRLCKSRKNKMIAGVCGGIAEYLEVDPVLVRLIAVLFLFTGGAAFIAYLIGMIIMPDAPMEFIGQTQDGQPVATEIPVPREKVSKTGSLVLGIILIFFGFNFLLRNIPFFHRYYWWFWDMGWQIFWPSILILIGLLVILVGARKR
jgi:phage shock protein C